jgi:hypothetical protein
VFIRFVIPSLDVNSHRLTGVFQAAFTLQEQKVFSRAEDEWLKGLIRWFDKRLPTPARLSRSRRANACANAISWFKVSAREHIEKIWDLVALAEQRGVEIQMIRSDRPGYVVYEDEYQVAAVPFRDTSR